MNEAKYLVDNNALLFLGRERIRSEFFHEFCRITADVLFEAKEHPDRDILAHAALEVTASTLDELRAVMSFETPGDVALVDLYKNKGAADPGLIATIRDAMRADVGKFFADEWTLVTSDKAVIDRAQQLHLSTATPAELADRIDRSKS